MQWHPERTVHQTYQLNWTCILNHTESKSPRIAYTHSYCIHSTVSHTKLTVNMPVLRHILEITGLTHACKRNGINFNHMIHWCSSLGIDVERNTT